MLSPDRIPGSAVQISGNTVTGAQERAIKGMALGISFPAMMDRKKSPV